jgi:F1F0 ATPase subunit 2
MIEYGLLLGSLFAGILLGGLFFGGLWWTVKRGLNSARPEVWFLGSQVLRIGLAIGGFFVVSGGKWNRLVACLAGFLIARSIVLRYLDRPSISQAIERDRSQSGEAPHAA